jgi:hypothetical protein
MIGLLLPAVLAGSFKAIFMDVNMFGWRLGEPFVGDLFNLVGGRQLRMRSECDLNAIRMLPKMLPECYLNAI